MTYAIAIDPGHSGGAAMVAEDAGGRYVLCAWGAWRHTRRRAEPYDTAHARSALRAAREGRAPHLTAAVRLTAPWACSPCTPHVVVEGITPHGRRTGYTALCEAAGVAVALVGGDALRPTATRWRADVLRLPATTAADIAEHEARVPWGWAADVRGRALRWEAAGHAATPPEWAAGHVAEAACMAVWAMMRKK